MESPALIDTHVHLDSYDDAMIPGLLDRARVAGVGLIIAVSVSLESASRTMALARADPSVVAAVGLHPSRLAAVPGSTDLDRLAELAARPETRAIGEIGLDSVDVAGPIDAQDETLRLQLRLAGRLNLPVLLHLRGDRDTQDRYFRILREEGLPAAGGVYHYFTGGAALARRALDHGLTISLGKPATRRDNVALRAAVSLIPLERLVLETDSYPLPGRSTEPADVRLIAASVAELLGLPLAAVADATTANARRLLGLAQLACFQVHV